MSDKNDKPQDPTITFDEFRQLCADAGIDDASPDALESDFRLGVALAEVTDELIKQVDAKAPAPTRSENRADAVKLAAEIIRYAASLHDEGKN